MVENITEITSSENATSDFLWMEINISHGQITIFTSVEVGPITFGVESGQSSSVNGIIITATVEEGYVEEVTIWTFYRCLKCPAFWQQIKVYTHIPQR